MQTHRNLTQFTKADRLVRHLQERRLPSNVTPTVSDLLDLLTDEDGLAVLIRAANRAENRSYRTPGK